MISISRNYVERELRQYPAGSNSQSCRNFPAVDTDWNDELCVDIDKTSSRKIGGATCVKDKEYWSDRGRRDR